MAVFRPVCRGVPPGLRFAPSGVPDKGVRGVVGGVVVGVWLWLMPFSACCLRTRFGASAPQLRHVALVPKFDFAPQRQFQFVMPALLPSGAPPKPSEAVGRAPALPPMAALTACSPASLASWDSSSFVHVIGAPAGGAEP